MITIASSALSAIVSAFATSRKIRNEGDVLVSNAVAARTQQLFNNLTSTMNMQQEEIRQLKEEQTALTKSLNDCHQQHSESAKHYTETLRRLEKLETLLSSDPLS